MPKMKQCMLRQGPLQTVSWIEARGAKVNASVEIPDLGGVWTVEKVFECEIDSTVLHKKQQMDRNSLASIKV